MATAIRLGASNTINRNTNSYATPTWDPITIVRDVDIPTKMDEVDASSRLSLVKMYEPAMIDIALEFDILEDVAQTDYVAIRAAFLARTSMDLMISTAAATATGEYSIRADFKVFKFDRGEPLGGINTIKVTMKPCYSTNAPTFAINS